MTTLERPSKAEKSPKGLLIGLVALIVLGLTSVWIGIAATQNTQTAQKQDVVRVEKLARDLKILNENSAIIAACSFEQELLHRQVTDKVHRAEAQQSSLPYPEIEGAAPPAVPEYIKGACNEYFRRVKEGTIPNPLIPATSAVPKAPAQ